MQIFELFGSILLKDNDVESQLDKIDKKASGTGINFDNVFSKIASAALKVGAIIGAGLGIKSMMDAATAGQDRLAQMNAVLESTHGAAGMTGDALINLAAAQSKLSLQSKGANIDTENLLLTFTKIGKDVFPQALTTINDMSQALGQDTKSSAIQLGKALNDPIAGITALSRVGVTFTAQQKDQIKTMVESGNTLGAQKIILAELGTEFGGSALAASKTFDGQMTILKNSVIGFGGSIASVVLPYLTSFVTSVNTNMPKIQQVFTNAINYIAPLLQKWVGIIKDNLMPIISDLSGWVSSHFDSIKSTISSLIDAIVPKFESWIKLILQIANELLPSFGQATLNAKGEIDLFSGAMDAVTSVLKFMKDNIELVRAGLVVYGAVMLIITGYTVAHNIQLTIHNGLQLIKMIQDKLETGYIIALYVAQGIHNGIMAAGAAAQWALNAAMNANPIGIIIALIVGLVAGLVVLFEKNKTFHDFIVNSWAVIKQVVGNAVTAVIGFFTNLGVSAATTWTSIKTGVTDFLASVGTFFTDSWNTIKTTTEDLWNGIKDFFKTVWDGIKTIFTDVVTAVITFVNDKFGWLIDGIKTIFNALKDYYATIWDAIKTVFLGVILLILDLVTGNFTKLKEDANSLFTKLKDDFSRIWNDIKTIFTTVITLIVEYFTNAFKNLVNASETLWNAFKNFLKLLWDEIKTTITTVWNSIKEFFDTLWKDIKETATTAWNAFKDFLSTLWKDIKIAASTAWNDLKTTVTTICKDIIQGAKDLWNGLLDWFRELPGKLQTIGSDMFIAMKNGISSVIGTIKTTVVDGVTTAIDWLKALPGQALTWGSDFIQGFVDGIMSKANALLKQVEAIANSIRGLLHFSTPDYGPLADYETWMPDFMEGLAKGIDDNKFKVINSMKNLTSGMKVNASIATKDTVVNTQDSGIASSGSKGDVYVTINSPTALSPSETARQLRRVQQELGLQT